MQCSFFASPWPWKCIPCLVTMENRGGTKSLHVLQMEGCGGITCMEEDPLGRATLRIDVESHSKTKTVIKRALNKR